MTNTILDKNLIRQLKEEKGGLKHDECQSGAQVAVIFGKQYHSTDTSYDPWWGLFRG